MLSNYMANAFELNLTYDPVFFRPGSLNINTSENEIYKKPVIKKWALTNIESFDIIIEHGDDILPVEVDNSLVKAKIYRGSGIYIIQEFNFYNASRLPLYKALLRRMISRTNIKEVKEFLNGLLDKLHHNELALPYSFVIVEFIPKESFIYSEQTTINNISIFVDLENNGFEHIENDILEDSGFIIDVEVYSKKNTEEILIGDRIIQIKPIEASIFQPVEMKFEFKDKKTGKIFHRIHEYSEALNLEFIKVNEAFKDEEKGIRLSYRKGLELSLKHLAFLDKEIISKQMKTRKEMLEIVINSLKTIFAENKAMQAALNVIKESISLEKEELNLNKEYVKTAGEFAKVFTG